MVAVTDISQPLKSYLVSLVTNKFDTVKTVNRFENMNHFEKKMSVSDNIIYKAT